ncbi:protein melted, partial [Caerostris extrusa]
MAAVRPQSFTEHVIKMKMAAELQPGTLVLVARILGIIGKLNMEVYRGWEHRVGLHMDYRLHSLDLELQRQTQQQIVNQTASGITIVKVGGNKQDLPHVSLAPFSVQTSSALPLSSFKMNHNGIKDCRSRNNLPGPVEARSMSQLGSLQAINRSMGRLPSSMSTL